MLSVITLHADIEFKENAYTLTQSQQLSSALSSAGYFKSHCHKQCGPISDCSSSLFAYMQKVCLKSLQVDAADDINIFSCRFSWRFKG